MKEKVYHYRPLTAMKWRCIVSCSDCGYYLCGNAFSAEKGVPALCKKVIEKDLSEYKFRIISDSDNIPGWCPLPDFKLKTATGDEKE